MRPQAGESTISYAAQLREKAANCKFHDIDERILEQIVQTTDNAELIRKVLHKKWTLQQTLEEMQVFEDTSMQVEAMGQPTINGISKINKKQKDKSKTQNTGRAKERNRTCKYCGRTHPMQKELCPAYGKFCSKCGKPNHFSTVCLSATRGREKLKETDRRDVRRAMNESESDGSESEMDPDIDFVEESVRHLNIGKIKINRVSDYEKTVPILINDVIVRIEPDSGADVNVMDEHQHKALKRKTCENLSLTESSTKLSTLQNDLQVFGEFKATARNQTRGAETTFVVVKGKINSPPLLGRGVLFELGMLEIRPDGSLKEVNELRRTDSKAVKSILDNKERSDRGTDKLRILRIKIVKIYSIFFKTLGMNTQILFSLTQLF